MSQAANTVGISNRRESSVTNAAELRNGKNGILNGRIALTDRQVEVLRLVAEGCSHKQIAAHLRISLKTVEWHKNKLQRELGVAGSVLIVKAGILNGFLEPWVPLAGRVFRPEGGRRS